jgi:HSP20 family molecular chaperone IbpA
MITELRATRTVANARSGADQRVPPPVDIYENDEDLLVVADLPGVDPSTLEVQAQGGELRIGGTQETLAGVPQHSPRRMERRLSLPATVDPDRCSAEIKAGVLRVRLAKAPGARRHRIQVESA